MELLAELDTNTVAAAKARTGTAVLPGGSSTANTVTVVSGASRGEGEIEVFQTNV